MAANWRRIPLRDAGVELLDCEHRTPQPVAVGHPYVAIPQLRGGRLALSEARRISEADFASWTRKVCPKPDDVVLSRRCNPGETAHVPKGVSFALGQNLVLLRADGSRVHPPFLRWLMRGQEWWQQVGEFINVGAVFESLRCADIPNFTLTIPPLPEQRAIAAVLGSLDDKIDLNRRMNATLEATARAIFKAWFVDFEAMPGEAVRREPAAMVAEGEAGYGGRAAPSGWTRKPLGECCRITMGQSPPGDTYNAEGLGTPLFQGSTDFGFRFPSRRVFCTAPTRIAEEGDTLLSVRAPVGDLNIANERCCVGRGVAAIRHSSGSSPYTYYLVETLAEDFKQFDGEGTVFGSVNRDALAGLTIVDPPPPVVLEFDQTVGPLDRLIRVNDDEARTLAALRDTLLPRLLSGEIRVRDVA